MERSSTQQSIEIINKSNNILIALPNNPSTDAIASGLGLFIVLEKMKKNAKVVCSEFSLPPSHQFLPKSKEIHSDLTALRKFIISLDVSRTKVEELSYNVRDDKKLDILITPKNGFYEARDVSTSASSYEYDLIIVVDSPDLESLGKIYDNNTEFFYHTPIINIDHNPANEYFGEINLIDLVATSTSEIIYETIKELKDGVMDEYIATSLLTGIISKTKSYQSTNVTPRSLTISSYLVENGARRDDIIRHLYRTKSINTLKLWGRALARLRTEINGKIVWSMLNKQDFVKAGAQESDLDGVIDELIINTPSAEAVIVLYEVEERKIKAVVGTSKSVDGFSIFRNYRPTGTKNFTKFTIKNKNLLEVEKEVLDIIKKYYQQ